MPITTIFCLWACLEMWIRKALLMPYHEEYHSILAAALKPSLLPCIFHSQALQSHPGIFFFSFSCCYYLICFSLFLWSNSVLGHIIPNFPGEDLRLLIEDTDMTSQETVSCLTTPLKVKLLSLLAFLRNGSLLFLHLSPPLKPILPMWCSREFCPWLSSRYLSSAPCKSSRSHIEIVYLLYVGILPIPLPLLEIRPWFSLRTPSTAPEMPSSLLSSPCVCLPYTVIWSICGSQMWCTLSELSL